ncbi:MAG: VCBS repeat-containing protein [Planctomycetota bacterium]|nr:VCBS repeat-containing protein [Planctomycetota bacterium]
MKCGITSAMALCAVSMPNSTALGQWIDFNDETNTRVSFQPFIDAPGLDPRFDDEEKDIAVGDLDRDGWPDLVIVRKEPFSNAGPRQDVLLMNVKGVLVDQTAQQAPGFLTTLTDARDVVMADVDGDGWLDVIIANTFGEQPRLYMNRGRDSKGHWRGLVDVSDTRLPTIVVANLAGPQFCALEAGDLTGDQAPDIYFANYRQGGGTTDVLLINDGTGRFIDESNTRLGEYANVAFGTGVRFSDIDLDGDIDILKISTLYEALPFDSRWAGILFNDGTGDFDTHPFLEIPNLNTYMIDVGDLDNDDRPDLYLVNDGQDHILINNQSIPNIQVDFLVTVPDVSPRTTGFGGNVHMGDVDRDGDLDVGIAPIDVDIANCGGAIDFALLQNDAQGALHDPWPLSTNLPIHAQPHDFAFVDLNRDGCLDIFMGLCTGWRVLIQKSCCLGDADRSGSVDVMDLIGLLMTWGQSDIRYDINPVEGDGTINVSDLLTLLARWGSCS